MTSTVIYAADGTVTGVRHAWTFDDMFSTFAVQGLESKKKGVFTREELQPLAEVNVTSLKEYDYFSYAKANGKKTPFSDPVDYHLELKNELLTLHFTLPLKTPTKGRASSSKFSIRPISSISPSPRRSRSRSRARPRRCKASVASRRRSTKEPWRRGWARRPQRAGNSGTPTIRGAVRQQDFGEVSVTRTGAGRRALCARDSRCSGRHLAFAWRARCAGAGQRRSACRARRRSRARRRPTAWSAGSSPSRRSSRCGMRTMLRSAKADGSAVWGLLGLSFLYGIFHAAGPGHGKAVISSYVVANHETWRRGVVLSFASAMLQAVVAVVFVGVAAWIFNATMATMCKTERWIEIVSYALIALIGLRLVWVKGRAFLEHGARHDPAAAAGGRRGDAAARAQARP